MEKTVLLAAAILIVSCAQTVDEPITDRSTTENVTFDTNDSSNTIISETLQTADIYVSCDQDNDCSIQSTQCCCPLKLVAVNKKYVQEWREENELPESCEDAICGAVACVLVPQKAICEGSKCKIMNITDQDEIADWQEITNTAITHD